MVPSRPPSAKPRERTALPFFFLLVACLLWVSLAASYKDLGSDYPLYLELGEYIVRNGVPETAVFTYADAAERPYVAHEWLLSVLLFAMEERTGRAGLHVVRHVLVLSLFTMIAILSQRVSRNWTVSVIIATLTMTIIFPRVPLRAELFGHLFLLGVLTLFVQYRSSSKLRHLAGSLPLVTLWANMHGSFLLFFVVGGAFAAESAASDVRRALRQKESNPLGGVVRSAAPYGLTALAGLLCVLLNPYGTKLLTRRVGSAERRGGNSIVEEDLPGLLGTPSVVRVHGVHRDPPYEPLRHRVLLVFGRSGSGSCPPGHRPKEVGRRHDVDPGRCDRRVCRPERNPRRELPY
jgi:hypothetical protein